MPKQNPPLNRPQKKWSTVIVRIRRQLSWRSAASLNDKQGTDWVIVLFREILHSSEPGWFEWASRYFFSASSNLDHLIANHPILHCEISPTNRSGHLVSCRIDERDCPVYHLPLRFLYDRDECYYNSRTITYRVACWEPNSVYELCVLRNEEENHEYTREGMY